MKKGISLVALVITIIVLVILTTTVILTAFNNGILDRSEEAVFKNNISTFQEDFANKKLKVQLKNKGFDASQINGMNMGLSDNQEDIKYWIPSITNDFIDRIYISKGIFKADKTKFTDEQIVWLEELGIEFGVAPILGTTDLWELDETNTMIVKYLGERGSEMNLTIPNKVKDSSTGAIYTVKEVSSEKIMDNIVGYATFNTVVISDNLTFNSDITKYIKGVELIIGDNVKLNSGLECFYSEGIVYKGFKSIEIGDNVTIIGDALIETENLQKLKIGNNVTIQGNAVVDSSMDRIERDNYIIIGDNFYCNGEEGILNCRYIDKVVVGDNATLPSKTLSIGEWVKTINVGKKLTILDGTTSTVLSSIYNSNLEQLNVGSFKQIGNNTLKDRLLLTKVVIEDGCTITSTDTFNNCTGITELVLGNATISSNKIFDGCTGIEKVTLSKGSGENFPTSLFQNDTNIKTVIIEDYCKLKGNIFNGCTGITNLAIGNNVEAVSVGCFVKCTSLTTLKIPGSTITNTTMFMNCTGLQSVELGQGLATISNRMFAQTGITSITIPSSVENIGTGAFGNCDSLTSVIIKNGVQTIGATAFTNCDILESIIIPSSVTTIESGAFNLCPNLTITAGSEAVKTLVEGAGFTGNITVVTSGN